MLISIIIPTIGRPELKLCVDSIVIQKHINNNEVIVVANSGPNNHKIRNLVNDYQLSNLRILRENKLGLSHAKNIGFKKASGEYIAYIDDDAYLEENWINNIIKFINQYPEVDMFGGPYSEYSHVPIPQWFPKEFARMSHGNQIRKLRPPKETLSGGNMVIKRSSLKKLGGFDAKLGISTSKPYSVGEETDLQIRASKLGMDIYYVPSLKIKHLLPARKMNLRWLLTYSYQTGKQWEVIHNRDLTMYEHIKSVCSSIFRISSQIIINYRKPPKYILHACLSPLLANIGSLMAHVRGQHYYENIDH